jgi:hypothetical protein
VRAVGAERERTERAVRTLPFAPTRRASIHEPWFFETGRIQCLSSSRLSDT